MKSCKQFFELCLTVALFVAPGVAAPVSSCTSNFAVCSVYEGQLLSYPPLAISGDVLVKDSGGNVVDVFRIFNDVVNTGGGTGLGDQAFLYGADIHDLPAPSTYSVNVTSLLLGTRVAGRTGMPGFYETDLFNAGASGTLFALFTPAPEPCSLALLGLGVLGVALRRKQLLR